MMKIKIYQINMDRDEKHIVFMGLGEFPRFQGSNEINSSLYDCVFTGEVKCKGLEDVYRKFNLNYPAEYKARSLSVSDVVEIIESDSMKSGFYFCDSIGFKEVPFDPSKAQMRDQFHDTDRKSNTISVLLVRPNKYPKMIEIENTLEAMQQLVGGDIEEYMPFEDEVAIICNKEDDRANVLPLNRAVYSDGKEMLDIIAGDFFIVYTPISSEKYLSLPTDLATKYSEKFRYPERFGRTKDGIQAVPFRPVPEEKER